MSKIDSLEQDILKGSSKLFSGEKKEFNRTEYVLQNMQFNEAFISRSKNSHNKSKILQELKEEYKNYRDNWVGVLKKYDDSRNFEKGKKFLLHYQLISKRHQYAT